MDKNDTTSAPNENQEKKSNVRSLAKKKLELEEKAGMAKREEKIPQGVKDFYWQQILSGKRSDCGEFPKKYAVYVPRVGIRRWMIIGKDNVVRPTTLDEVCSDIAVYNEVVGMDNLTFRIPREKIVSVAKWYFSLLKPICEPQMLRFKSDPGTCWHRLDFDLPHIRWEDELNNGTIPDKMVAKYPWAEIFSRCSNWKAVAAFLGSIFIPESYRQQYLYIYGKGFDSKSSLATVLYKLCGETAMREYIDGKTKENKHWMGGFENKRLALFPDCAPGNFLSNPLFKTLTGEDEGLADLKGGARYNFKLHCKCLLFSNEAISLERQTSNLRRVIYAEILEYKNENRKPKSEYDALLWEHRETLIDFCVWMYYRKTKSHSEIEVDDHDILKRIAEGEEFNRSILDQFFDVGAQNKCRGTEIDRKLRECLRYNQNESRKFKYWLETVSGIANKTRVFNMGGYWARGWVGVKPKTCPDVDNY